MTSAKPKVLLLTGGINHDFPLGSRLITQALSDRFEVIATQDPDDLTRLDGGEFAAVVLYIMIDQALGEQAEAVIRFVENGGGLLALHATSNSFTNKPAFTEMIGVQPEHGYIGQDFQVDVADPDHPVTARTSSFTVKNDEVYELNTFCEFKTFATTHWHGKAQPVGIEHPFGAGRVLYLAIGHEASNFGERHVQRMIQRSVRVATGERIDATIRAGILGYGGAFNMGKRHAQAIDAQPGMRTVAVCDIDPARAAQATVELGDHIKTWTDPEAFFKEGDFDLCIQILPHNLHAEYAIKALQQGRHVVTEKPFCITLDEADAMIGAAEEAGRMLSCFHNRRWDGDYRLILELVRSGVIGEVYRIDAATAGFGRPGAWWRSNKSISGGVLYDWGAHFMDWTLGLINQPITSVTGDVQNRRWHHVTNEDYAYALIRFANGATATLEQGSLAAARRDAWRILGTHGAITSPGAGKEITLIREESTGQTSTATLTPPAADWNAYYANVGNHLLLDEPLIVTPQQARRAIGVLELAERSAAQGGQPLPLPGEQTYKADYLLPW